MNQNGSKITSIENKCFDNISCTILKKNNPYKLIIQQNLPQNSPLTLTTNAVSHFSTYHFHFYIFPIFLPFLCRLPKKYWIWIYQIFKSMRIPYECHTKIFSKLIWSAKCILPSLWGNIILFSYWSCCGIS